MEHGSRRKSENTAGKKEKAEAPALMRHLSPEKVRLPRSALHPDP